MEACSSPGTVTSPAEVRPAPLFAKANGSTTLRCVEREASPRAAVGAVDSGTTRRGRKKTWLVVGIPVAAAIVAGLVTWLLVRGDNGNGNTRAPAQAVSMRQLDALASSVGHPVYWAGPQPRDTYELTKTSDGRIYVRYLPPGAKIGDPAAKYLAIGTYPQRNAFATLKATATKQGVTLIRLRGGGLSFQDKNHSTSVYLAYPGSDYQIEVYDPSPARARALVTSGQISAVGAPPRGGAVSRPASVEQLKALAVSAGHPIYWAGTSAKDTYEVTKTRDGRVYIRYLPAGVPVGNRRPDYLTVGTYPLANAFALLKATAKKNNVQLIKLPGGGLAFVDKNHPTSVYLAYPSSNLEIEVYDPSSGRARQLVTSGQIAPVR